MDPGTPDAKHMLDLLRYVDGDLGDPATYQAMSDTLGQSVQRVLFYLEVPPPLFARIAEGISAVGRAAGNRWTWFLWCRTRAAPGEWIRPRCWRLTKPGTTRSSDSANA
jgi:Glucose-6-phosphate dehydrogenase, NAD binding domain